MHTTTLVPNRTKKKAYFTMALLIAGSNILLVGCAIKKPYRGFLMVEKPPIRIIVYAGSLSEDEVQSKDRDWCSYRLQARFQ